MSQCVFFSFVLIVEFVNRPICMYDLLTIILFHYFYEIIIEPKKQGTPAIVIPSLFVLVLILVLVLNQVEFDHESSI